ncbi:MAG: T9SS type A sorting domain-containing protein, partial [Paludibacteraceae bacterium]|nr:T9SS type A sorting domain-containing protein [Paludibacteraceae bacterium]
TNPQALTNPDMTISVPNGPANTTYTLTNVKIREKNCAVNIDEANVAEPTLAVIPNPAGNVAFIQSDKEVADVEIINLAGQKVMEVAGCRLQVAGLQQGLYLLQVRFIDGTVGQTKLIKR